MPYPVLWTDGVCSPSTLVLSSSEDLNADYQVCMHMLDFAETYGNTAQQIRPLTGHALLQRVRLLLYSRPNFVYLADTDMHVPEAVVVISWIFVVDAALHREAR